ncbi:hypothetical protein BDV59DRAFT_211767 [Aspergillus ambiguus]|uniref:uncharacterized protein n=1 Tax=Aspergillus ambiguus TaxID=176160 RepID=UPI003CCE3DCF
MEDMLVVLKTGATEAQAKVPVHLNTTLSCVPHYTIISDYEEEIGGVRTHDVLRDVTRPKVTEAAEQPEEFALYDRLRARGRQGLLREDWRGSSNSNGEGEQEEENGPFGKSSNRGWRLDKWKFLPMLDRALQVRPTAQWYIFVEADTYVVWANLVAWLRQLDAAHAYYLGAPMQSGDAVFAYGGAGIVLSQAAVRRVVEFGARRPDVVATRMAQHWAGDAILGRVLQEDVGVPLVWAWPMLQTSRAWELDSFGEGYGRAPWCYPAVSYHHMTPEDVETLWRFEREWFQEEQNAVLLHGDVFKGLLFNRTAPHQDDWDNLASAHETGRRVNSLDECALACDDDPRCLQFSFRNGTCMTSPSVIRGVRRRGVQSGWMPARIEAAVRDIDSCPETEYILG